MSSNEEYLDNLLKSMNGDAEKGDNAVLSAEDIEAMFAEAEKAAVEEEPVNAEQAVEEPEPEPMDMDEVLGSHTVESTKNLSQDEIEQLLAMSEQADAEVAGTDSGDEMLELEDSESEDLLSLLGGLKDDEDLGEIGELLDKSDHNVAVDEDMLALLEGVGEPEGESVGEDGADKEADEASFVDNTEESPKETWKQRRERRKQEKKAQKEEKAAKAEETALAEPADPAEDTGEEEKGTEKKAERKSGVIAKLFSRLLEEEPEEPAADENQAIMKELEEEDKKAAGKKKKLKKGKLPGGGKKGNTDEEDEEEEGRTAKGKKKEKPKKAAKPKKVKVKIIEPEERPSRRISKKSIFVVLLFAATIFAAVYFAATFLSGEIQLRSAREAFERQDYVTCYESMYGMKLSEEEQNMFRHAEIVLKLQRRINVYENFLEEDRELEALDSLMRAVAGFDELYGQAQSYGAGAETAALYSQILEILENNYGLTEADARAIAFCGSNADYTRYLTALVEGVPVSMGNGQGNLTLPQGGMEDILPAEEELTQPEFAD